MTFFQLTDTSLVLLVNNESSIESLTVANNTHVTGLFLTGTNPSKLSCLGFFNCYSLQGTVLSAAIEKLPNLTTLKLDAGPMSLWKMIPQILKKLPQLEELSLSEYTSVEQCPTSQGMQELSDSLATLTHLKALNLSRNIYISNAVLKQIAQSCPRLQTLNVSCCNSRRNFPYLGTAFATFTSFVTRIILNILYLDTRTFLYLGVKKNYFIKISINV